MFNKLWQSIENFASDTGLVTPLTTYTNIVGTNTNFNIQRPATLSQAAIAVNNPLTRNSKILGTGIDELEARFKETRDIQQRINYCKTVSINALNENPRDSLRCGWIFKKRPGSAVPEISQGALGIHTGPVRETLPAGAQWFWSIEKARNAILEELCGTINSCNDLKNPIYSGKCGWCVSRGKGIPIVLASKNNRCGLGGDFIQSPASCPVPTDYVPDVCDPDTLTGLSVECLSKMNQQAGCTTQGTIALSLSSSQQARDFADKMNKNSAFKRWKDSPNNSIDPNFYSNANADAQIALQEFQRIQVSATTLGKSPSSLNAATRDLCYGTGNYDKFDFCTEINDSDRGPYKLDCLQKLFKSYNGTQNGIIYPNERNIGDYNRVPTWGVLKSELTKIKNDMYAEGVQKRKAVELLTGVKLPRPVVRLPRMSGVEIFWIDLQTNTLIKRIINDDVPSFYAPTNVQVAESGKTYMVSFLAFVNIQPNQNMKVKYQFTTDDAALVTQNKQPVTNLYNGQILDQTNYFSRYYDQAPTTHQQYNCNEWSRDSNNILTIMWEQKYGYSVFNLKYSPCNANSFVPVNKEFLTLVQDPKAPFWSFEAYNRPNQYGQKAIILCEKRSQSNRENRFIINGTLNYGNYSIQNANLPLIFKFDKYYTSFAGTQSATYIKNIAYAAIGTITMAVYFEDLPNSWAPVIALAGQTGFHVSINKVNDGSCRLHGVNDVGSKSQVAFGQPIQRWNWYFLTIRLNKNNNTFSFSVIPYPKKSISARILFDGQNSANLQSSFPFSQFVDNPSIAGKLVIGGNLFKGAVMWVHMFDYEMKETDDNLVNKEIRQKWQSAWYE